MIIIVVLYDSKSMAAQVIHTLTHGSKLVVQTLVFTTDITVLTSILTHKLTMVLGIYQEAEVVGEDLRSMMLDMTLM